MLYFIHELTAEQTLEVLTELTGQIHEHWSGQDDLGWLVGHSARDIKEALKLLGMSKGTSKMSRDALENHVLYTVEELGVTVQGFHRLLTKLRMWGGLHISSNEEVQPTVSTELVHNTNNNPELRVLEVPSYVKTAQMMYDQEFYTTAEDVKTFADKNGATYEMNNYYNSDGNCVVDDSDEVVNFWLVSEYMYKLLTEHGHITFELHGLYWYCQYQDDLLAVLEELRFKAFAKFVD